MPPAAMHQAIIAPNGPVAFPKVRGSEKMPAPIIDPTTIAVKENNGIFCTACFGIALPHPTKYQNIILRLNAFMKV